MQAALPSISYQLVFVSYVWKRHWLPMKNAPTKDERKRLRGEGYKTIFIDCRFDRWGVVGF